MIHLQTTGLNRRAPVLQQFNNEKISGSITAYIVCRLIESCLPRHTSSPAWSTCQAQSYWLNKLRTSPLFGQNIALSVTESARHQFDSGTASASPGDSDAPPSICLAGHAVLQMVKVGDAGCDSPQTDRREESGSQPGWSEDRKVSAPPFQHWGSTELPSGQGN